ncbi:MAG: leucine-rich repeat domain-containing protein, partial [Clostridia bacterium]|nr:leucine-rich repeat domain-containing protein [Clostridia bacterium]
MKKFITTVFSLIISLVLTGCITVNTPVSNGSGNGEQTPPETPVYATQYSFDQTHHWYAQLNGDGKKDYAEHENEKGKCYYCDFYFETDDVIYELKYNYNSSTNGYDFYYVAKDYVSGIYSDVHIEIPVMHYQALPTNDAIINDYAEDKPYPVLELGKEAFRVNSGESSIETIKLNEGLKKIGESAFRDCLIKELVIPNSVEGTLSMICVNCTLLERAVVGNGVTKLSAYSFSSCGRLKTVVIGEKVTEIGQRAFYD